MKKHLLFLLAMLVSGGLFSQIVLLNENMDSYATNSFLAVNNPTWFTTWGSAPGSSEDALILETYAHSPTKSASIDMTGGATDLLLKLGNKTSGTYEVKWWMYVETGKCAYYNIQHFEAPGTEWAFEIYFRTDGTIHLTAGGITTNGTYPKNTWFEVKHIIQLNPDSISLIINGTLLNTWPFHWQNSSETGTKQLGAVDFYAGEESGSGETPGYYVDDIGYSELGSLPPTVVTMPATAITSNTATLNGTVNANISPTAVTFEYGLTTAYGTVVAGVPGIVNGNTATPVSANLTGLLPGATYHYRVHAINSIGYADGNDLTFTTLPILPVAITTAATGLTNSGATLNGTINAGGAATTVTFEYGLTNAYGTVVAGVPGTVTGNAVTPVSATISGLTVNTIYHYRVVGVNSVGPANGADMTFLTPICPFPGNPGPIAGPINGCGNSLGNVYSVSPISEATGYAWTLPAGSVITAGANTNSITVTLGTTSGNVTVNGTNTCGNGPTSSVAVTVNPAPVPTITGSNGMCVNSGYFNYSTEAGYTNYTWTISAGGTINYGLNTNTIQVQWNAPGAQSVSVNYTNSVGCQAGTPTVFPVTVYDVPAAAGTISGTDTLCGGETGIAYTTDSIPGTIVYVWTLPAGATIASGSGTNSITVDFAGNASSGNITVYGNNLCGNGAVSPDFAVTVNPLPAAPVITEAEYVLSSDAPEGNQWYQDGTLIPGATSQTYAVTMNGEYWDVVTLNNCSSDTSNHIIVIIEGIDDPQTGTISVYPNPNDGQFTIKISSLKQETFNISVVNNIGLKIMEIKDVVANENIEKNIDLRPVPDGIYSVVIRNSESIVVKKILVNN